MKALICNPDEAAIVGHHASLVLNQIRYWLYKAHKGQNQYVIERFGIRWVAHSREQLVEETGFSSRQLRCALERLKLHQFIVIEQHLFRGKNVSHFRAAVEGPLGGNGPTEKVAKGQPAEDGCGHPDPDKNGQLLILETNLETKGEYGALHAPVGSPAIPEEDKEEEKKEGGGGGPDKLPPSKCDGSGFTNQSTPKSLAGVFRKAWDAEHGDVFLPEFESKDLGQFKNIIQRTPPGLAGNIVDHCVRHWVDFCIFARDKQGAFNLPELPQLGTLLVFVQSAANLYLRDRPSAGKKQATKILLPPIPSPASDEPKAPGDKMATLEEAIQILGYDHIAASGTDPIGDKKYT